MKRKSTSKSTEVKQSAATVNEQTPSRDLPKVIHGRKSVAEKRNLPKIIHGGSGSIDSNVDKLMRVNPHLAKLWVTPDGFAHPVNSPAYLVKGATLYKNKYYKK